MDRGRPETGAWVALLLGRTLAEARLEAGHAATGVEDLLLARVERVALEQTSARMEPSVRVLRVVNDAPQVQLTAVSTYSG